MKIKFVLSICLLAVLGTATAFAGNQNCSWNSGCAFEGCPSGDCAAQHKTPKFRAYMQGKGFKLDTTGHPFITLAADKYGR